MGAVKRGKKLKTTEETSQNDAGKSNVDLDVREENAFCLKKKNAVFFHSLFFPGSECVYSEDE